MGIVNALELLLSVAMAGTMTIGPEARHNDGLNLFEEQRYEEAACGRDKVAMRGLARALSLELTNRKVLQNMRSLRDLARAASTFPIMQDTSPPTATAPPGLLEKVKFLDGLRQHEGERFMLRYRYLIPLPNYRQIPELIRLTRSLQRDKGEFAVPRHWGQYSAEEARRWMVRNLAHPVHQEFVEILSAPEMDAPSLNLSSAREFRRPATSLA